MYVIQIVASRKRIAKENPPSASGPCGASGEKD